MTGTRKSWPPKLRVRAAGPNAHARQRSDDDLKQLRHDWRLVWAAALISLSLAAWVGTPRLLPLFLLPPVATLILVRLVAWQRRKAGKRFNSYDDEDSVTLPHSFLD